MRRQNQIPLARAALDGLRRLEARVDALAEPVVVLVRGLEAARWPNR